MHHPHPTHLATSLGGPLLALLLLLGACGGSDGTPVTPGTPIPGPGGPPTTSPVVLPLAVTIRAPVSVPVFVTADASIDLGGTATGDPDTIAWMNAAGGNGSAVPGTTWSASIPLQPGDNRITVEAHHGTSSVADMILVVRDAMAVDVSPLTITPAGTTVDVPVASTFHVHAELMVPVTGVELWRVAEDGSPIAKVTDMEDFGDPDTGDEEFEDGTFSAIATLPADTVGRTFYRARILHGTGEVWSGMELFDVAPTIDESAFADSMALQQQAMALYETTFDASGHDAAATAVLQLLQNDPLVRSAGRASDIGGIWIAYVAGFVGTLMLAPEGTKGGWGSDACEPIAPSTGYCLSPFEAEFKSATGRFNEEARSLYNILDGHGCLGFNPLDHAQAKFATVEGVAAGATRGVLVVSSHGDTMFAGGETRIDIPYWGTVDIGDALAELPLTATPYFLIKFDGTAEQARKAYQSELALGQLIMSTTRAAPAVTVLGVTPRYVADKLCCNDTIVYISACRSAFGDGLADAFLQVGALAYVGYDGYVGVASAQIRGETLIQGLSDGKRIIEAVTPGTAAGAAMRHHGNEDVRLAPVGVVNGSFEQGLQHWGRTGVRSVSDLGDIRNPDRDACNLRMAEVWPLENLSQRICVPSDATHIQFRYNFVSQGMKEAETRSEEVITFTALLGGATIVEVDSLDFIDDAEEVDAGYAPSFSDTDGKTFQSGWRTVTASVSQFQDGAVVLRFEVDAIDTANAHSILIEDVKLITAP